MKISPYLLVMLIVIPLLHSPTNAQWNPILYPPFEGLSKRDSLKVALGEIFSSLFIAIFFFILFKLCIQKFFYYDKSPIEELKRQVIENCPIFVYSTYKEELAATTENETVECTVCLTEFEDTEIIKMLPQCKHVFHKHCIEAWLPSRMTCPICRQNLTVDTIINIDFPTNVVVETQEHGLSAESEMAVTETVAEHVEGETEIVVG